MGKTRHLSSWEPCLWQDTSSMYKPGLNDMQWENSMMPGKQHGRKSSRVSASSIECEQYLRDPMKVKPGTMTQAPWWLTHISH